MISLHRVSSEGPGNRGGVSNCVTLLAKVSRSPIIEATFRRTRLFPRLSVLPRAYQMPRAYQTG